MEQTYPQYYDLKYAYWRADPLEVQQSLEDGEVLYQYFWGDSTVFAFRVTQEEVAIQPLDEQPDALETKIRNLLDWVQQGVSKEPALTASSDISAFTQMASTLGKLLFPWERTGEATGMIIVPDGIMGYLPFDILIPGPAATETPATWADVPFLFTSTPLRYAFSSTLLQPGFTHSGKAMSELVSFAPDYSPTFASAEEINRVVYGNSPRGEIGSMGILTQNGREAREVQRLLEGKVYIGMDATEDNFKKFAPQYRFLHLASHAYIDDENPRYSGLVFTLPSLLPAGDSLSGPEEDGILRIDEIYNLEFQADLAVLSACNTGIGKYVKGEGLKSLGMAFRYAGCPNITTSLWAANDFSTREVMTAFYRQIKEGKGKTEALRQAKLEYLSANNLAHPFYWAGFVMIGDNQPIRQKGGYVPVILVSMLLAGLGIFYGGREKGEARRHKKNKARPIWSAPVWL